MLGAGFAQLHAHVNEAGREAQPAEIDDLDIVADAVAKPAAERGDAVALGEEVAGRVEPALGVEQAGVAVKAAHRGHGIAFRALSSTVMAGLDPAISEIRGSSPRMTIGVGGPDMLAPKRSAGCCRRRR